MMTICLVGGKGTAGANTNGPVAIGCMNDFCKGGLNV